MKLTTLETKVAKEFAQESIDACGYFDNEENMSFLTAKEIAQRTGLNEHQVGGVITSLLEKGLIIESDSSKTFEAEPEMFKNFEEVKDLVTE